MPALDLLIPVKSLAAAKSRLACASQATQGHVPQGHAPHGQAVLALLADTVAAAVAAEGVRRAVVITPDPLVAATAERSGAYVLAEAPARGLNAALEHGEAALRRADPAARVAALLGDLPALRAGELAAALASAGSDRAFSPDLSGHGTTLLVAAAGARLRPRFGADSAAAHRATGAAALAGPWPSVRCDVDTAADLRTAAELGLGEHTAALCASRSHLAGLASLDPTRG